MIVRIFYATPKPGKAQELLQLAKDVSIPFVDKQPGLVGRYFAKKLGDNGEQLVVITVWKDLEALKNMTGEDWQSEVIPDPRLEGLIQSSSIAHYETLD